LLHGTGSPWWVYTYSQAGIRQGDAAPVSLIELVEEEMKPQKVRKQPVKTVTAPKVTTIAAPVTVVEPAEVCEASAD